MLTRTKTFFFFFFFFFPQVAIVNGIAKFNYARKGGNFFRISLDKTPPPTTKRTVPIDPTKSCTNANENRLWRTLEVRKLRITEKN